MNTATAITIAALTAMTPTVTCLIGIILSRQDVRDLRNEMNVFRNDLERFRAEIRDDMLMMRKDVHADLLMIHERVATWRAVRVDSSNPVKPQTHKTRVNTGDSRGIGVTLNPI